MARLAAVALLLILAMPVAVRSAERCASGRFVLTSELPAPSSEPLRVITFDANGTVAIDGCGPTLVTPRAGPRVTRFRARWTPCGDHARLRLRARIAAPACAELRGRLRGTGYAPVAVTAVRSACGDGILDGAVEQCDGSAAGGDLLCPGNCGTAASDTPCECPPSDTTPHDLTAAIAGSDVQLTWRMPSPASGFTEARLVRRLDTPPTNANDPTSVFVFTGTTAAAVDALSALLPTTAETSRTYHYAVFACIPGGACETTGSRTTLAPTVIQVLTAGGYVIHWRHASATVCSDNLALGPADTTTSPNWWRSCEADCGIATARQLNTAGRTESTTIGDVLRARGIPFGRVVTSEFCRNVESATLMALGPTPEEDPGITYFVYDEGNRCANAYALLAAAPAPGTNTALIGHAGFGAPCAVLGELAWGEGALFKPDGAGGATFITRVLWDDWSSLP